MLQTDAAAAPKWSLNRSLQVLCPAELKPRSEVGSMQKYFECQNAMQNGLQAAAVTVYVEQ